MRAKDENGRKVDLRVREIPPTLKAHLKSEAALMGKTLNEYVLQILMERPGREKGEVRRGTL
jgi:predicted HicB family RNase H-like nuclease